MNSIASQYHVSKHSIARTIERAEQRNITFADVSEKPEGEVYSLLFPERQASNRIYAVPDYAYVTQELRKVGVTLKLLHEEYLDDCKSNGKVAVQYSKFCSDYESYRIKSGYTNRVIHKPGARIEVDWSGPTMKYTDRASGCDVKVYLFAATLPYSQFSYIEPCLSLDQQNWMSCNINMPNHFGGVTPRVICDNLRTGIIQHPREGEIILNDEYENLAEHYGFGILPAGVRKPKHKASVEGTVGDVATAIIAKLRNSRFSSFEALSAAVREKLEEFNEEEFNKREGSRLEVFLNEEKPALKPLPEVPYEPSVWYANRTVQLNSHVAFEKNYYSCPWRYLRKQVDLKVSSGNVEIYHDGVRIQIHKRFPPSIRNQYSTVESDMPADKQYQEWNEDRIRIWASDIGKATETVISRIFEPLQVKEQGFNSALSVLRLSKKYGSARLENACQLAIATAYSPRYRNLNAILLSNQDEEDYKRRMAEAMNTDGLLRGPEYYKRLEEEHKC